MTAASRRSAGALLGVAVLLASGCAPADSAGYRESAAAALGATLSSARSAELAGRLWVAGRSTHPFAGVVVEDGEAGVGSEAAWFEGLAPPTRADDVVRRRTTDAIDGASDAVQQLRIALDRSDRTATRAALGDLRKACADVEALAGELG